MDRSITTDRILSTGYAATPHTGGHPNFRSVQAVNWSGRRIQTWLLVPLRRGSSASGTCSHRRRDIHSYMPKLLFIPSPHHTTQKSSPRLSRYPNAAVCSRHRGQKISVPSVLRHGCRNPRYCMNNLSGCGAHPSPIAPCKSNFVSLGLRV